MYSVVSIQVKSYVGQRYSYGTLLSKKASAVSGRPVLYKLNTLQSKIYILYNVDSSSEQPVALPPVKSKSVCKFNWPSEVIAFQVIQD